jgi:hypothetical protein
LPEATKISSTDSDAHDDCTLGSVVAQTLTSSKTAPKHDRMHMKKIKNEKLPTKQLSESKPKRKRTITEEESSPIKAEHNIKTEPINDQLDFSAACDATSPMSDTDDEAMGGQQALPTMPYRTSYLLAPEYYKPVGRAEI